MGSHSQDMWGAVHSKTENGASLPVAIGSMMSIQRYGAEAVTPNGSSSSSELEKRTTLEIITERSSLLTDTRGNQRVLYVP